MMKFKFKHFLYALGFGLMLYLAINFKLVSYGIGQAKGQLKILNEARPISEVLNDPEFPDSLKRTLKLVDEIKKFAVDSLGLKPNNNYQNVYDQKGQEVLWVVTACDPYQFEPLMWDFPVIGSFTYKGFFNLEKAKQLALQKMEEGYDVSLRPVSAWSTLGWFSDPILSNMLADGPGELANTIIHELTHGTLFVPDSMTFNENLATFIGNRGAEAFLRYQYGDSSGVFKDYVSLLNDRIKFSRYIIESTIKLDSLYLVINEEPDSIKLIYKKEMIASIMASHDTVQYEIPDRYQKYFDEFVPNNAYFVSFLNYRERQDELNAMLEDTMNGKLHDFIDYWEKQYGK